MEKRVLNHLLLNYLSVEMGTRNVKAYDAARYCLMLIYENEVADMGDGSLGLGSNPI